MKRTILLGQDIAQLLFAPLYLFQFWLNYTHIQEHPCPYVVQSNIWYDLAVP